MANINLSAFYLCNICLVQMRHLLSVSRLSCVLFHTWWCAGSRVVLTGRMLYFVCRQRDMSRVSAHRLHAVVSFRAS
jgi:hypothetical protein